MQIRKFIVKQLSRFLMALGGAFLIMITLSFTSVPYYAHHRLGEHDHQLEREPDFIVLLGGSGMPSPDGLMRCYYAAQVWKENSSTKLIIAHTSESTDSNSQIVAMANELVLRGVKPEIILYEHKGTNTYFQIERVVNTFLSDTSQVLLVTSPQHVRRSVLCFHALGIQHVAASASFAKDINEELLTNKNQTETRLSFRYNMWSYLQYQIIVLREYTALLYYKLKGWN